MTEQNAAPDKVPVLMVTVAVAGTGEVIEILYTDAPWNEVVNALKDRLSVYDTEKELNDATNEENDRG
jgi:hypothetical protein